MCKGPTFVTHQVFMILCALIKHQRVYKAEKYIYSPKRKYVPDCFGELECNAT